MVENCLTTKLYRFKNLLVIAAAAAAIFLIFGSTPLLADSRNTEKITFLPMVSVPARAMTNNETALSLINQIRATASVPLVTSDVELSSNCYEHARYMANNNLLAHDQDPGLPYATTDGEECARNANAWLGSRGLDPGWSPADSINCWMSSIAHRLWLLYPTTGTIGYGFYNTLGTKRAAAALDILSYADFAADETYAGWPVRFPQDSFDAPPTRFPITLNWRYFGPEPELLTTALQTAGGAPIPHDATTSLPIEHKGIQIIPRSDLPADTSFVVTVSGRYDGQPFNYSWTFHTAGS